MKSIHLSILSLVILGCSLWGLTACSQQSAPAPVTTSGHSNHQPTPAKTETAQKIPHYFADPAQAKPFPKTLDPAQFSAPSIKKAYETARRIPEVLAQQPCFCYCDQGFGHGSLLDCHIDDHSAG
ncbi:MAG: hypothetical protein JST84_21585 [Acidobacteria bacterium]|nr:hypothetical protein [Acidobacteriota bacterium]